MLHSIKQHQTNKAGTVVQIKKEYKLESPLVGVRNKRGEEEQLLDKRRRE